MAKQFSHTFNADRNPKQARFLNDVIAAAEGQNPYRYFFFGGAIRGGKTSAAINAVIFLCLRYPGMRAHIIRKNMPMLMDTTHISFLKFCPPNALLKTKRSGRGVEYHEFVNGSRIYYFPESTSGGEDLDRFKGLETNVILLEQIEEVRRATYEKSIERVGSHYIKPMPKGLILATFNPHPGWLKAEIHDKHSIGELKPPYYYLQALPSENPYVTDDQWANWQNMPEVEYRRFIEGDWTARDTTNLFAYNFETSVHVGKTKYKPGYPLWLSFDFNVSPMTCIAGQHGRGWCYILQEWKVPNIGVREFIRQYILPWLKQQPNLNLYVTGDPAGRQRHALSGNLTYYRAIQQELRINTGRIKPAKAYEHEASRVRCNTVLEQVEDFRIDLRCDSLTEELSTLRMTPKGKIEKDKLSKFDGVSENYTMGHLLDCFRYYLHNAYKRLDRL